MNPERKGDEPLTFPVFEKAQIAWRPKAVNFEAVVEETEAFRRYYLEHFDSPELRLRSKNPKPFRLDP